MRAARSNVHSTKTSMKESKISSKEVVQREKTTTISVEDIQQRVATDQTGWFSKTSSRFNKYILVMHDADTNAILAEPIKDKLEGEHIRAIKKSHGYLRGRGFRTKLHILDNECSKGLKDYLQEQQIEFQLVPPNIHRTNPAEKAIDTFKNNFVMGLCTVHPNFPLNLWCRLVPLAVLTLNMLRPSKINPRLSAEEILNGSFNYDSTSIAPPGSKVIVHKPPNKRGTWASHGVDGWYLGPAHEHYQCHQTYARNRVEFFPRDAKLPQLSTAQQAARTAQKLIKILTEEQTQWFPIATKQVEVLTKLSEIFLNVNEEKEMTENPSPREQRREYTTEPPLRVTTNLNDNQLLRVQKKPTNNELPRVEVFPHEIEPNRMDTIELLKRNLLQSNDRTEKGLTKDTPHVIPPEIPDCPTNKYNLRARAHIIANVQIELEYKLVNSIHKDETTTNTQANAVLNFLTGNMEEYLHLMKGQDKARWIKAWANDLGRLVQGVSTRMPRGTNTIFFIHPRKIPKGRKVSYCQLEVSVRPTKEEMYRLCVRAGGDGLEYPGETPTNTTSLTNLKLHLNSTISTPGARFITADISNFYCGTPMTIFEYIRTKRDIIPDEIAQQYNLDAIAVGGWVYLEIRKGMPGLKQAGRIANERLTEHLKKIRI